MLYMRRKGRFIYVVLGINIDKIRVIENPSFEGWRLLYTI